ncbi:MAG: hypothetical protein ABIZ71_13115 [Gemmatimonadales bacterium]
MIKSLIRTFRGPSRDPRMAYISRPLPRHLPDEQVLAAMEAALAASPDPERLVETLPPALRAVTGHTYQVLDRSTGDVTGTYRKVQIMIRDGEIGLWPGYAARAYPMLAEARGSEAARAAIAAADGGSSPDAVSPTNPVGKAGWKPPALPARDDEA